jgi:pyruvate kinase
MRKTGEHITILQDLQGPKIRIGELSTPSIILQPGHRLRITTEPVAGSVERISTTFENLPGDVRTGDDILLDDGKIRLRVQSVDKREVFCEVLVGGTLTAHKGINLPGVAVSAPSLTEKDLEDLDFGMKYDVDYVALSFVRSAGDIKDLRREIGRRRGSGRPPSIIAKIEKPQAIADINAIIAESDGIMIARGDLGVELPAEDVPLLQKMIVKKCNAAGKPVIIATQMLESMIASPTPTRAEASDVANAVLDGADALMLSGETSVGRYPQEAVQIMDRIIRKVESERLMHRRPADSAAGGVENRHDALGRSACVLAEQMKAAAIVTVTNSGQTARVISRYRPDPPIVAVTDSEKTLQLLNIVWGVRGLVIGNLNADSDKALEEIQGMLVTSGIVRRGENVVLLAGQPFLARGSTNFIKVEKIL